MAVISLGAILATALALPLLAQKMEYNAYNG